MSLVRFVCGIVILLGLSASAAQARPAYAMQEGKDCTYCHIKPASGCNFRGFYYREHNHSFADFDNLYEAKAAGVSPDAMGPEAEATVPDYPNIKVPPALHFSTAKSSTASNPPTTPLKP